MHFTSFAENERVILAVINYNTQMYMQAGMHLINFGNVNNCQAQFTGKSNEVHQQIPRVIFSAYVVYNIDNLLSDNLAFSEFCFLPTELFSLKAISCITDHVKSKEKFCSWDTLRLHMVRLSPSHEVKLFENVVRQSDDDNGHQQQC